MSMLLPHPHESQTEIVRLRQQAQSLHRLLNSAEAARRRLERERDQARWQLLLSQNRVAALQADNDRLSEELGALAGCIAELETRLTLATET